MAYRQREKALQFDIECEREDDGRWLAGFRLRVSRHRRMGPKMLARIASIPACYAAPKQRRSNLTFRAQAAESPHHREIATTYMKTLTTFCAVLLLGVSFQRVEAFTTSAPECVKLNSQMGLVQVVPSSPKEGEVITVCSVVALLVGNVSTTLSGNRITITIHDNGSTFGPDPPVWVGEVIGPLVTGPYLVDVFTAEGVHPASTVATNVRLDVVAPSAVPVLGIPAYLLLVSLLGCSGAAVARYRSGHAA
jgi:hypothetical protein